MTGLFITFEGGDGAGKSTQVELLKEWLLAEGETVVTTREPGGTDLGQEIRKLLLHGDTPVDPRAEALLYAADRAHHIATVVKPALARGEIVVQDRYIDSSLAYQGAGRVLNPEEVKKISEWATEGLWPDLTVLLDIDPMTAQTRREGRGEAADRIEKEKSEFHTAVREGFLALAKQYPERTLVCDANLAPEEIAKKVRARLRELSA